MRAKRIYGINNVLKPKSEEEIKDLLNTTGNKKEIFKKAIENGLSSLKYY